MRILFLTYELPLPANTGDRIYTSNLLQQLISNGHYVHLVVFGRGRGKKQETISVDPTLMPHSSLASRITTVPFAPKSHVRAFFSFRPGMIANRFSRQYMVTVQSLLTDDAPFDAILVNHFKMAYLIEAIKSHGAGATTVMITHNAEAMLNSTLCRYYKNPIHKGAYYLDQVKAKWHEPRYFRQFDGITAICQGDYQYFTRVYGLRNVEMLTPGVNLSDDQADFADPDKHRSVIVCGSFTWGPKKSNLLYFLNCRKFKLLSQNGITVYVVGQADPEFVDHVNSVYPGVTMTGSVTNVRDYYSRSLIAMIPELMGGGFKLKLLEAASMKNAVISLKGVITAPGFMSGIHYLESADFDDLIETTLRLINQPEEIRRLALNAYDLIQREYRWENSYCSLMRIIQSSSRRENLIDPLLSRPSLSQQI